MVSPIYNLLARLPFPSANETTNVLLQGEGVRLERIVSHGHASPPGFWYDQSDSEWVVVVSGHAHLAIEGELAVRQLGAGDVVYLPAGCRHRVAWTDPAQPTVWLALFIDTRLRPTLVPLFDVPGGNLD